jgi:PhnB protein
MAAHWLTSRQLLCWTGSPTPQNFHPVRVRGDYAHDSRRPSIKEDAVSMRLNPYVAFEGNARAAMKFYATVFGGELRINTFGEFGMKDAAVRNKVMHAMLETDHGFTLMASDLAPGMEHTAGNNITISLSGDDADTLRGYWKKLSRGGEVTMPLEKQMWGDEFGQCKDKFGISWMVNIAQPQT